MEEARRKKMPKPAARPPSSLYKKISDANASSHSEQSRLVENDENRISQHHLDEAAETSSPPPYDETSSRRSRSCVGLMMMTHDDVIRRYCRSEASHSRTASKGLRRNATATRTKILSPILIFLKRKLMDLIVDSSDRRGCLSCH